MDIFDMAPVLVPRIPVGSPSIVVRDRR